MDYGLYNRILITPTFHRHTTSGIRCFYEGGGTSKFHMGDVESGIFIVDVCIEHWGNVPISTIPLGLVAPFD